jgi:hypothetical protein
MNTDKTITSNSNFLNTIKTYTEEILGIDDLLIKSRKRHIVDARKIYCKLARINTTCSFEQIAKVIGKDHATVIYNIRKAETHIEQDVMFRTKYHQVLCELPTRKSSPKKPITTMEALSQLEKSTIRNEQLELKIVSLSRELKRVKERGFKKTYTKNEFRYRELSLENQEKYNFRVSSILNMLEIVERKEEDKYERINIQ